MTIPARFLDELRARLSVSEIVGKRVKLTRAGREFKGCCPFHHEKTPSFYVNDDKQFFHCFGCGAHGTVIDFVMRLDNLSFPEAVESLASRAGMQVPKSAPEDVEKAKREKSLYTLMDDAAKWMEAQLRLPANKGAFDYIKGRGVPDDILHSFRVGYAPDDRQALRKHLTGLGYTDAQMIECSLLKKSDKSPEPYDFFRERIMFPVPDRRGRIVAFGGRTLPDHLRAPSRGDYVPAKYMNSGDTPLFHKGNMLYGEPHARKAAADGLPVIVVEGYLDVIAAFRGGFRGAVAPLGTALTEEQIFVLWKMIPDESKIPVLCFDGDSAGRRAASRACERILPHLKPGHSAKIAFLPDGEDPDTLINKRGKDAFAAILSGALNLVDFVWLDLTEGRDLSTPEAKAALSKALDECAGRIADRTVQHYYKEAFRERVRAAFSSRTDTGGRDVPRRNNSPPHRNGKPPFGKGAAQELPPIVPLRKPGGQRLQTACRALLCCILNNPFLAAEVEEELGGLHFPEKPLDRLRQAVLSVLARRPDLDAAALQSHLEGEGYGDLMKELRCDALYTHAGFARPCTDEGAVLMAWKQAWAKVQDILGEGDAVLAKQAFQEELSPENEARWESLRKRPESL